MANGNAGITLGQTTNMAVGTASTLAFAKWALGCLIAHHLTVPDDTTLTFMCGYLVPFGHVLYLAFAGWFAKKTGVQLPPPQGQ